MKYLVLLVVVVGILWWWRWVVRAVMRQQERPQPTRTISDPPATAREEQLVPCARCGVLVPRSEAHLADDGAYYCCDDHRRLGSR